MNAHHGQLHTIEPALQQREERRPSDLRGWFTRTDDGSGCDFVIINLSYGGCQLRTGAQLQVGEQVSLSVVRRGFIEAEVKWRCGELYGLAFAMVQPAKSHSPREVERHKATINVLVRRQGRTSQQIEATDVSRLGCCLDFVDAPRQGDRLWVQLPCLEPIETDVRWVDGFKAGVAFTKPIHPAVFDLLLEAWTSQIN
jgi:hypothetical protein